jgi:hypothetical protein
MGRTLDCEPGTAWCRNLAVATSVIGAHWLQPFVRDQPISQLTETLRGFTGGHVALTPGWCNDLVDAGASRAVGGSAVQGDPTNLNPSTATAANNVSWHWPAVLALAPIGSGFAEAPR